MNVLSRNLLMDPKWISYSNTHRGSVYYLICIVLVYNSEEKTFKSPASRDGVVSPEEFYHYCSNSTAVSQSMCVLP